MYVSTRKQSLQSTYISSSRIQGQGLFAGVDLSKDEIIIDNLFPHKDPSEVLYNPITESKFKHYMGDKTAKINHCSREDNSKVITSDNKIYQLVSIKDIPTSGEITVNYDVTHSQYPFIVGSNKEYIKC